MINLRTERHSDSIWESRLAASIRVHIASQRLPIAPALTVYSDYLQPLLDKSKVIVDPTRHVVDATERRRFPKLPYVTVRVAWMACEHYGRLCARDNS